jgi:hypothetical protein
MFGGVSILSRLIGDPTYMQNPLRQDLGRVGKGHLCAAEAGARS